MDSTGRLQRNRTRAAFVFLCFSQLKRALLLANMFLHVLSWGNCQVENLLNVPCSLTETAVSSGLPLVSALVRKQSSENRRTCIQSSAEPSQRCLLQVAKPVAWVVFAKFEMWYS